MTGMKPPSRISRRKAILWCGAIFITATGALYAGYRIRLAGQVREKIEEIRKRGYPITPAELSDWFPRPPEGKNGADLFKKASDCLPSNDPREEEIPPGNEILDLPVPLPAEQLQLISLYLEDRRPSLEFIRQGASLSGCRFPMDLKDLVPSLRRSPERPAHMGRIRNLLYLQAVLQLKKGNSPGAMETARSLLAVAKGLSCQPGGRFQYLRIFFHRALVSIMERALSIGGLDARFLDHTGRLIEQAEQEDLLTPILVSELCLGFEAFRDPSDFFYNPPAGSKVGMAAYTLLGRLDRDRAVYLETMREMLALGELPPSKRGSAYRRLKARVESIVGPSLPTKSNLISALLLPQTLQLIRRDLERIALLRAASAALGVERFRRENGRLPKDLKELVPSFLSAVPGDSFHGEPLRYGRQIKGYIISSAGESAEEDGGEASGDVTFTVER